MSIHTDKAYRLARSRGAQAARSYGTWQELMTLSKRELAEIAMHLGALCADNDSYEDALAGKNGQDALARVFQEHAALKHNGAI